MKPCVTCDKPRHLDTKFCNFHLRQTRSAMNSAKYLTFIPPSRERPRSARENVYETKFGVPT